MLPYLNAPNQEINMITQFGGYNHKISINENEFFDMKNMSSKDFPLASTRKKRGIIENDNLKTMQTITAKDNLIFAYTGYGDIGVTLAEPLPLNEWVNPIEPDEPDEEVEPEEQVLYTTICKYNDNELTRSILGSNKNLSAFSRYTLVGNKLSSASGKEPEFYEDTLRVEWEHEIIPKGTLWAKKLFEISHWYSLYPRIVSVKTNSFLNDSKNRELLIGKTLYIDNGEKEVTIDKIEKSALFTEFWRDDWTIKFSTDLENKDERDSVYVRLTEPLPKEIPAGKYTVLQPENPDAPEEEPELINQPSEVLVNATSETHVKVLKGKTISFVDDIGTHECKVADYKIEGGQTKLIIACPHDAVKQGATAYGDRLFLCELNPQTNKIVTSNIFSAAEGRHTVLEMGANIVIFPEKIMVNTQKFDSNGQYTDIQSLEKTFTSTNESTLWMVDFKGERFAFNKRITEGTTAPTYVNNGDVWIDTSNEKPSVKVYSEQIEQWAKMQTYCSISSEGIGKVFEVGDAVELEFEDKSIIGKVIVPADEQKYFVISKVEDGAIYFPVIMTAEETVTGTVTVKRTVPDMDFVIENENRLWGCKYGEVDGEPINEIFACKLGDPKNWHHFTNTSIDSYYVNLGADGEFTGAISYAGNPFFFREGCVHRIYGNYPSNYALKTVECHGVEKGSERGITIMNDVMYYKSPVGIMAYTGATPVNVSEAFGDERYKNAVAGAVGSKMYFSMTKSDESSVLFVFDDKTKMWHKEDDMRCIEMVTYDNEVYALSEDSKLYAMDGGAGENEEDFEWYLQSGSIGYTTPFYKHIGRINVRLLMERNTRANISIQYDSDGNWHHVTNLRPSGKVRNISVPIQPQRCDHFALRLEGKGGCQILSITKFIEEGSENE